MMNDCEKISREMTFEEEAALYQEEALQVFSAEEGDGESSFVNNVVCRGWRIIRKAREEIAVLRAQLEAQENEPLSVEALRMMVGMPVWVQPPGLPEYGKWAIVEGVSDDGEALFLKNDFTCHEYGRVWVAYRRPPVKEGQNGD